MSATQTVPPVLTAIVPMATRSDAARESTVGGFASVVAAALTFATVAALVTRFPALDPNPPVARDAYAAEIARVHAGFAEAFARVSLLRVPSDEATFAATFAVGPGAEHHRATMAAQLCGKVERDHALAQLLAIPADLAWERGVARRHGRDLDGTEPVEDVASLNRV